MSWDLSRIQNPTPADILTAEMAPYLLFSSEHIGAIRLLRLSDRIGTCFWLQVNDKGCFVTARHILQGAEAGGRISLSVQSDQPSLTQPADEYHTVKNIFHHPSLDFSLFSTVEQVPHQDTYFGSPRIGQPVLFCGFPHGLAGKNASQRYLTPIVKSATLAAYIRKNDGADLYLVDGINNPGFSGGPVFIGSGCTLGSSRLMPRLSFIGIVSSYIKEKRQFGRVFDEVTEKGTSFFVHLNSGLAQVVRSIEIEKSLVEFLND